MAAAERLHYWLASGNIFLAVELLMWLFNCARWHHLSAHYNLQVSHPFASITADDLMSVVICSTYATCHAVLRSSGINCGSCLSLDCLTHPQIALTMKFLL